MKKLMMIAVAISLGACATPRAYNHIDVEARPLITQLETTLIVAQSEIGSEIDVYYSGDGLIPALIDANINAKRTSKAEEFIAPVRDAMIDFDFGATLESDLINAFTTGHVDGTDRVKLVRGIDTDFKQNAVQNSEADAVMFIDASYNISANFGEMIASAVVQIFPVSPNLRPFSEKPDQDDKLVELTDNIYRNAFRTSTALSAMADRDSNARIVSEMTSEELTKALSDAATLIAKQIAADILRDDTDDN